MSDYYKARVKAPEGERTIYLHQGKDVPWAVVERLGRSLESDASLIFGSSWSHYVSFVSGADSQRYRLYEENREKFYVESNTYGEEKKEEE
jgi:hypothetical protein